MRKTVRVGLPTIESGKHYAPDALAEEIINFEDHPQGGIRAVRGPCVLVPDYNNDGVFASQYGTMHGVFHAMLDSGMRDTMLVRTGDKLIVQRGYEQDYETLQTGLSNEGNVRFPDQFCEVAGKVIWTNGVNAALAYDGYLLMPLGYSDGPGAPMAKGPDMVTSSTSNPEENPTVNRNSSGYSHPGRIGTPGDVLAGQQGCLRQGAWYYWGQWEDTFGNLSPLSAVSGPVTVRTEDAAWSYNKDFIAWNSEGSLAQYAVGIDDLTKQFFAGNLTAGPDGTVAYHLFRSQDTMVNPSEPRLVVRIPDNNPTKVYPDNHSDAELGGKALDVVPVPHFKVMCPFGGGLAIANTSANPGIVMISEAGAAGTFLRGRWVYPDPNGAEVTGLANFDRRLLAFTINTVFEITERDGQLEAIPLTSGIGCVAPSSIKATGFGALVWLGRDGFYGMAAGGAVENTSVKDIDELFKTLNLTRLSQAVAEWCPRSQEYLCAVTPSGQLGNTLVLAFNGAGWKRRKYKLQFAGLTLTKDERQYVVGCGALDNGTIPNVYVLDRETRNFANPQKTYLYRTNWLRLDPHGRDRFDASCVYVGFVESSNAKLTWRTYQNGRRDVAVQTSVADNSLTLVAPDLADNLSTIVLGTGKVRRPRLFWRKFTFKLTGVDSFAFDLEGQEANDVYPHIVAFMFDVTMVEDKGATVPRG